MVSSRTFAPGLFCCGILPRAGTWSEAVLWDFESGCCSIHGGISRGSPWEQDEIVTVTNGFPRGSVNNPGWFEVNFLNAVSVHPVGFPRAGPKGKHGLV